MALLSSIQKDVKWRLADPVSLVMWIGIPVLIGTVVAMVFGGSGVSPKAKLLVADRDDSFLTRALIGASGGNSFLQIEKVEPAEGRRRIGEGDGSGLLVIPAGFTDALIHETPVELEFVTNPSQTILPKILQEGLEMGVDASFYLQRLAGDLLREMDQAPPAGQTFFDSVEVAAMSMKINNRLKKMEKVFFPPVLSVGDELTPSQESGQRQASTAKSFNFGIFVFPGILFMSLMFIAQGVSYDIWREKDLGTLARLLCSPTGAATFMLSKMVTGTLLVATVASAGLLLGYLTFDLPLSILPGALLWTSFAGASLLALFFVIQMLASSSRGANVLTSVVVFPLMMIGGSFIPFGSMPKGMVAIGQFTPNGLAVVQLHTILRSEVDAGALATAAMQLGIGTLVLFALATRLLRTRFATR